MQLFRIIKWGNKFVQNGHNLPKTKEQISKSWKKKNCVMLRKMLLWIH